MSRRLVQTMERGQQRRAKRKAASRRMKMQLATQCPTQTIATAACEIRLADRSLDGASDASERGADEDEGPLVLLEDGVQDSLKLS